jgi:hypothetical protein
LIKLIRSAALVALLSVSALASAAGVSGTANVDLKGGDLSITFGDGGSSAGSAPQSSGQPRIPAGHMPPRGKCRIWYHDRGPGQQPPPGECGRLRKKVPRGASLIQG